MDFLDEGLGLAALLRPPPPTPCWDRVLPACDIQAPGPDIVQIEPSSHRERQVLHLIAGSYGNRAIAEELVAALGAVTAHSAAICRQLDVNGRTQAVARACALSPID